MATESDVDISDDDISEDLSSDHPEFFVVLNEYFSSSGSEERAAVIKGIYEEEAARVKIAAIVQDLLASPVPNYSQIAHAHNVQPMIVWRIHHGKAKMDGRGAGRRP